MTLALVTETPVETDQIEASKLAHETVVLQLEVSTPSFRKKVDSRSLIKQEGMEAKDKVDTAYIHTSKDLIDTSADAYRAITGHASRFRTRWLKNRTVPCTMLKAGMVLVPLENVDEVDRGVQQFMAERKELVKALIAVFADYKAAAQEKLGKQFDPADYPTDQELEIKFGVRSRFWGFNVPAALENVNRELFERERAKVETEWKAAADEIREALRVGFADLVDHMVDRLTPEADGKPKVFRNAPIDNIKDFLDTFASRNLTRDDQLADLVAKAKALMSNVKPDLLRKNQITRDRILEGFSKIKESLDPLVVTRVRQFNFDEE